MLDRRIERERAGDQGRRGGAGDRRSTVRQPARSGPGARPGRAARRAAGAPRCGPTCPTRSGTTGAGSSRTASTTSPRSRQILELTDDEREGLSAPDKFRVDITPYFISLIDPEDPTDPIRRQVIPPGREQQAFTAMMEDSLAEDRHSPGARPRAPLSGPGADAGHHAVRLVLPLLHALAHRRRPDPELQPQGARGAARVPAPHAPGARRAHLRRRRSDPRAQALRVDPARPARDPAHRDHPHRLARAGLPAAAHRRRAVRHARAVPPAVDEPPLQPSRRDHARGLARRRPADPGRHPGRQPVGAAGRRQRLRAHPARPRPQAGREPHPALLPLPVRPGRGLGPLPDAGRQGPRDHRGPARPHVAATPCRRTSSTRPGGGGKIPVMPNYLISYSDHKVVLRNYEGYITTYEEPPTYERHDSATLRATASTSAPSPASRASSACSRASACGSSRRASRRSTAAATPSSTASRTPRSGCPMASAPSRARHARHCRSLGAGAVGDDCSGHGRRRRRRSGEWLRGQADLRPGRGAAAARGRADRLGSRRAALVADARPAHGRRTNLHLRATPSQPALGEDGPAERSAGRRALRSVLH